MSLVGAAFLHAFGWWALKSQVAILIREHTGAKENGIVSDAQMAIARRFHRSPFSLILSWMPFALLAAGNTACSLILDAGYIIVPWAILGSSMLFGLGFGLAVIIRPRRLRKLLFTDGGGGGSEPVLELVTVFDPKSQTYTKIPAVELAPGMVRAQLKGTDEIVWIDPSHLKQGEYRHPPFEGAAKEAIISIQNAFPEVYEKSYAFWEDGFRRDAHPAQEIGLWMHIADVFGKYADGKALDFRRELFSLLVGCSTADRKNIGAVFERGILSKAELDAVVGDFYEDSR